MKAVVGDIPLEEGAFLYVPSSEVAAAMTLGAVWTEGEARLRIPTLLPDGVFLSDFKRWVTQEARVVWVSEFLETLFGTAVDMVNVAGLIDVIQHEDRERKETAFVPLCVPRADMDRVRVIPGVEWNRSLRRYVARRGTNFDLIFPYLTPGMRAIWNAERQMDVQVDGLTKSRALLYRLEEDDGGKQNERVRVPEGEKVKTGGSASSS